VHLSSLSWQERRGGDLHSGSIDQVSRLYQRWDPEVWIIRIVEVRKNVPIPDVKLQPMLAARRQHDLFPHLRSECGQLVVKALP
jgi:hypothetical protein